MNILVITPIYPSAFSAPNATPLVHYYTRKWIEQGHHEEVLLMNPNIHLSTGLER